MPTDIKKRTLRRRLIVSTVAIVWVISSLFAGGLFLLKKQLEEATFGRYVQKHIEAVIANNLDESSLNNSWFSEWLLYRGERVAELPVAMRARAPGSYHNITFNGRYYHLDIAEADGEKVFLLYDITDWEQTEHSLLISLFIGVLVVLVIALLLASRLADSILAPVKRLSARLKSIQPNQRGLRIAPEFGDSDIEQIAQAFDAYLTRIDHFVEREQLFTAAASHELRTPLSVMLGAVDVLEANNPAAAGGRALQRIRRACAEMQAFIEASLLLSREKDNTTGEADSCQLAEVVAQVVEDFRGAIAGKGLELVVECEPGGCLPAPASIVKISIANLLRNALEHTAAGTISVSCGGDWLTVADTGEGIASEDIAKVFERSYSTKAEGTGLGLNLVKRICDRFCWAVNVASVAGQGTQVTLNFAAGGQALGSA
ncbi:HAMP domain-containing sensor histidine kinase [Halioxenophilus sp. WMMB6]|uniref:sensor histidine kinase n=1 Tax=Halioxenophilus sp. WMMB6 TaxID=3073815 RepID=UPI00295E31B7|nr:HAMP domain-containing sensor histidine kinase [Halioxenophilus sp. WMMB6]